MSLRGKFEFNAKLEHVLGKVLDGIELPREAPGPKLPSRFLPIKEIGKGAQSSVYVVFDTELDCKAALKVFKGGGERAWREARVLSNLEHPNVVRVLDVEETEDGRRYVRMEFIDGPTLRKWVVGRKWREVLAAYVQAGRGLAAAHEAGVVHRDFKPENALVRDSDNRVVVVDFGLARGRREPPAKSGGDDDAARTRATPLQQTGPGVMGTPGYMAPEQWSGQQEKVDERSDQFNFCVSLYEALDGELPFASTSYAALQHAVTHGKIKRPPRNTPAWVWRALRRGLSVDPAHRYPSMNALLVALENDPRKWIMRAAVLVAALALVAGGVELWQAREDQHQVEKAQADAGRDEAEAGRTAALQRLVDREDAITLQEVRATMDVDPTRAMARLAKVSADSKSWSDPRVRMLAADADYHVVARSVVDLEAEPYGLSPDGRVAITRTHTDGQVSLHRLDDNTREAMGVAVTGLPVVAFAPDGRALASQRVPEGVHRWDLGARVESTLLGESSDDHHRILFFAGDGGIVTFGRAADVVRWHAGAKQVLADHLAPVDEVAVDPKGRWAATFDGARQLRLWDLGSGEARTLERAIEPMAFSPDGSLAVTGVGACSDLVEGPVTEVQIVDPTTDTRESLCTDSPLTLSSIAFSVDGKRVAAAAPGHVHVWDLASGERIDLDRPDEETSVVRFATVDVLGSQSNDSSLVVWVLPNERPYVLRGHAGVAHWGRRDDGTIVTYGNEGHVRLWTLPKRGDRLLDEHSDSITQVVYTAEGLVTAGRDGSIRVWPNDGGAARALVEGSATIGALAVGPGGRIAFTRGQGAVVLIDIASGEETLLVERDQVHALAWDAEGHRLAVADNDGLDVLASSGEVQVSIREPDGFTVRGMQFHRDGTRITTAGHLEDDAISIRVFDTANRKRLLDASIDASASREKAEVSGVTAVAFSPDARRVAVTTFHRSVIVWDEAQGVRVLGKHDRRVPGADFSPDGEQLVTVDEDGVAKLWDVATGFSRTIRFRHPLRAVAFAPDGETFAAVGDARFLFVGRDNVPRDADALRRWVEDATDLVVQNAELDWAAQ